MKPFSLTWELTEENKALPFFLGVEAFKFFYYFCFQRIELEFPMFEKV